MAFDTLIEKLTSTPVLAFADYQQPFIVQSDASGEGLGAVLTQKQDGKERVIALASRALTSAEARYPAHKLEFRALHWAVTTKFRDYLYGQKITAMPDNNPLTYVMKKAKLDAHGHRWVSDLSAFDLDIIYRPGKANGNADALSRIPRGRVRQILLETNQISSPQGRDKESPESGGSVLELNQVVVSSRSDMSTDHGSSDESSIKDIPPKSPALLPPCPDGSRTVFIGR